MTKPSATSSRFLYDHGTHVSAPQPGTTPEEIAWRESRRGHREREVLMTCTCKPIVFELVHARGVAFIRKVVRTGRRQEEISDSPPMRAPEAEELWARLLSGEVI
jgi:hypothetical protein